MWYHIAVVSKTKYSKTKTEARSTQISKTKHPNLENEALKTRKRRPLNLENEAPKTRKRRPQNLENEAPKTRNHCRFNNCNFTSCMTQSESGGGSGCVRTSKGPQNPSQGSYKRVSMGWWHLRVSAKILALLRLSVNVLQLRLTKKLKIDFFCFKKLNIN